MQDEPADEPKGVQAIGPAWLRGEIEKPAGVKDHGTWKVRTSTVRPRATGVGDINGACARAARRGRKPPRPSVPYANAVP